MMNSFGNQFITPYGIIDQKVLDRIKRRAMKAEIEKWITVDPAKRHGFEILSEIRSKLQR